MSWHVETEMLASYALGTIDEVSGFSVEAHLLSCPVCRERVTALVDRGRLDQVWGEIEELVDAPSRGPVERLLLRLGVSDHLARLLAATPSLTLSWLAAVALALAFAVVAAHESERGLLVFLALAPLLPLAGVAAAYGPGLDPTYEIGLASPLRSFRLLLIRATAVLGTTTLLAAIASLALPQLDWRVAAWLLPALGLTTLSLALATYVSPLWASGALAFLWIALVTLTATAGDDRFAAFGPPVQLAFLAVSLGAAVVLARRRDAFETRREL
jgi:hypothetical protein